MRNGTKQLVPQRGGKSSLNSIIIDSFNKHFLIVDDFPPDPHLEAIKTHFDFRTVLNICARALFLCLW
jgi:hypothetical protein